MAIGEAKWHEVMGLAHLERLRHIRGLLSAQGRPGAAAARLLCFSGAGFTTELRDEATRSGDLCLLTPADLYAGILLLRQDAPLRAVRRRGLLAPSSGGPRRRVGDRAAPFDRPVAVRSHLGPVDAAGKVNPVG